MSRWLFSATLTAVALIAQSATAHPFHLSLAEAEFNASTNRLEVALRLNPNDLELALRRMSGRRILLEKSPDVDRLIQRYLKQSLVIKNRQRKAVTCKWVGKEVSVKDAWLYFEYALPDGLSGLEVTSRIFFELQADQINTIHVKWLKQRTTMHLRRDRPSGRVQFAPNVIRANSDEHESASDPASPQRGTSRSRSFQRAR